jgi:hypothetical protein
MPITFDGTDLPNPVVGPETQEPSIRIQIKCNSSTLADLTAITAKASKVLTSKITVNGKVRVDGDGVKGSLVFSGRFSRTVTNCYIMPAGPIEYSKHGDDYDLTIIILQDTTS